MPPSDTKLSSESSSSKNKLNAPFGFTFSISVYSIVSSGSTSVSSSSFVDNSFADNSDVDVISSNEISSVSFWIHKLLISDKG